MSIEIQNIIDNDRLKESRNNLNNFSKRVKRRYELEIDIDNNKLIDEVQLDFVNENPELTFEEIRLIKKFCDYMKKR